MSSFLTAVLLANFVTLSSPAQGFETISARFVREFTRGDVTEQVFGSLYCHLPDKVTLRVTSPVDQWMVFEENLTTIYYPRHNTAFRIASRFSPYPPFVQSLAAAPEPDYGLSRLGYRPREYHMRGDTLVSYWAPPKQLVRALGEVVLKICADRIIYVESRSANGKVLRRSFNSDHVYRLGAYFPVEIMSVEYSREDSTMERVSFSDLAIDSLLPDEVTGFSIPADADIREVEW